MTDLNLELLICSQRYTDFALASLLPSFLTLVPKLEELWAKRVGLSTRREDDEGVKIRGKLGEKRSWRSMRHRRGDGEDEFRTGSWVGSGQGGDGVVEAEMTANATKHTLISTCIPLRAKDPSEGGKGLPELERMTSHLPSVSPSPNPTVSRCFPTSNPSSHPLHQTSREINHLPARPTNNAERIGPVPSLRGGLVHGVRPVLVEEYEKLDETSGGVDGEEEGAGRL
jgi:hypothetical protein